jgi:hypothetical protein
MQDRWNVELAFQSIAERPKVPAGIGIFAASSRHFEGLNPAICNVHT